MSTQANYLPNFSVLVGSLSTQEHLDAIHLKAAEQEQTIKEKPVKSKLFVGTSGAAYEMLDEIAKGGMGVVYRARRINDGEEVAVKIPNKEQADLARALLERESKILDGLNHGAIVKTLDMSYIPKNGPYMVMELIPGRSLRDILEQEGPLSPLKAVHVVNQVAEALSHAHDRGVMHRDIKPDNIMISENGDVHILDFGISSVSEKSLNAQIEESGSVYYIVPEQVEGEDYTEKSDIYQLALVLFQALTGELPFERSMAAVVSYKKRGPVLPETANLQDSMRKFLESCLSRNPQDRPENMKQFADQLMDAYSM